jgi:hypothetical protein
MDNHDRPDGRRRALFACCLLIAVLAAACANTKVKAVAVLAVSSTTTTIAVDASPSTIAPTTAPTVSTAPTELTAATAPTAATATTAATTMPSAVTTTAVVGVKQWVTVAEFSGSGDKEGNTFTMTGAPARVMYKASNLFTLNIDTGDPADDTAIGSCPAAGCSGQGVVHVTPGGWYLHVVGTAPATATAPATTYSVTLQEYR